MALIQVAMEVPEEIALGLATGDLVRRGGVVRDTAGHIVKHLNEVDLPDPAESAALAQKAAALAKRYKYPLIGIGIAVLAAVGGVIAYKVSTNKAEEADKKLSEEAEAFNEAMGRYLNSVSEGRLSKEDLLKVIEKVDDLQTGLDEKTMALELDAKQLRALVGMMRAYTEKLAEANDIDLKEEPATKNAGEYVDVILLRHYLGEQQRILEAA